MSIIARSTDIKNRISAWFVDREFIMRANGQVRFLKISARLQRRVASIIMLFAILWIAVTLGMAFNQFSISVERMALVRKQAQVQTAQQRVAAYRDSIDDVTRELEERQNLIETLSEQHLGITADTSKTTSDEADDTVREISMMIPEAAGLARIEARQIRFAEKMTKIADQRAKKAEAAIRQFGLNPRAMARNAQRGLGGPFIPFFGNRKREIDEPRFVRLASALEHMDAMEQALAGIPTSKPAAVMAMSSGFGYRRDPFTRAAAMHSGVDFKGPTGTPILAAAKGRVSFVGRKSGYGNCVEVTHANGLVTRYAHLSKFDVHRGQAVQRGEKIARMGSTGRSTGSHLHFEVRLNGKAVNPRKFLEANNDVLEIQNVAGIRAERAAKKI